MNYYDVYENVVLPLSTPDTNNCTVVAFASVFDISYERANKFLMQFGRRIGRGMQVKDVVKAFENIKYYKTVKGPYSRENHMFKNSWSCYRAFFCNMSNNKNRTSQLFCFSH